MALDHKFLVQTGTPVVFADTTDYSSAGSGYTRTAQIDLTSLADTKARQSDKVTLPATRGARYRVRAGIEFGASAPTAGEAIYFYWSESHSSTAATGNDGGCSGSDAAYQDSSESEWLKQLTLIGVFSTTNDGAGTVQIQTAGEFTPGSQYGQLVVWNEAGQALDSDATNMFVALIPIEDGSEEV